MPHNYIIHTGTDHDKGWSGYASKYYDPQKAHEYYMKNRVLKGYNSSNQKVSLNEAGKQAKDYVLQSLKSENATNKAEAKSTKLTRTTNATNTKTTDLTKAQEDRDTQISNYAQTTQTKIAAIQSRIKQMGSAVNKERVRTQLQKEIDELRNDNAAMKASLQSSYANTANGIKETYASTVDTIKSDYQTALDDIASAYESTKISELEAIYNNPEFTKKSSSKSSKKTSDTSTTKKSTFKLKDYTNNRRKSLGVKYGK